MLFGLCLFLAILVGVRLFLVEIGHRRLRRLENVAFDSAWNLYPKVSIVIPARNEAPGIAKALESVLALDYPDFEVLVLDDRSTDDTGLILDRMAEGDPRLRVFHIHELPQGWLGKNHALHVGAGRALGSLVLFSDADVVFQKSTLKRAVQIMEQDHLDHLALLLKAWSRSFEMECFLPFFALNFLIYFRPWEARDPRKKNSFIGVGAFNFVRKSALGAVGNFSRIPLRPDDDVKLGKILKQAGYRQECMAAAGGLSVEWYPSLRACMQGLEKNMFSGTDYRVSVLLFGVFMGLLIPLLPLLVLVWGTGLEKAIALACLLVEIGMSMRASFAMGTSLDRSLFLPIASVVWAYIALRAMVKNLWQGGIYWRDTFYPLKDLKKNRV